MATSQNVIVEGFITDSAFTDQSKSISDFLGDGQGQVATLTPKILSYFNQPDVFTDTRTGSTRSVNWAASTHPKMIVDESEFGAFITTINGLSSSVNAAFFKIIDRVFFKYSPTDTLAALETFLTTDTSTQTLYVASSLSVSSTIVAATVYPSGSASAQISVPASATFTISLTSGSTTTQYTLTVYTSTDAFLPGYTVSTIVKIIPPLPFDSLYNASLVAATGNIFSTAAISATLSYNTTQAFLDTVSISGLTEYNAVLTDGTNTTTVPFNIFYKGRPPSQVAIRTALQSLLANCGVGNLAAWKARIPGIYVVGRFYVTPLWDQTYTKPDQIIFPSVIPETVLVARTNLILSSLGFGDLRDQTDVLSLSYNRMWATAVPDLSGTMTIQHISQVIPDYQNYAASDENFSYMLSISQQFANQLTTILALASGASTSTTITPVTENLLTFYSLVVQNYEICVITKTCYTTILESSL